MSEALLATPHDRALGALRRAFVALAGSRPAEAHLEIEAALAIPGGGPEVALLAARMLHGLRDHQRASDVLDAVAVGAPSAARVVAYELKFELATRIGWYREALAAISRAIALAPTAARYEAASRLAFQAQNPAAGLAFTRAAIALDPRSAALRLRAASRASHLCGEAVTRELIEGAVALAPDDAELAFRAASILLVVGAFDRAEQLLLGALASRRAPLEGRAVAENAEATAILGQLHLVRGEIDEGAQRAEAALALDPACARAHRVRGAARVLRREHAEALPDLDEAIRRDPRDAEAFVFRAEAKLGLGRLDEAMAEAHAAANLTWNATDYIAAEAVRFLARQRLGLPRSLPTFGLPEAMAVICPDDPENLDLLLARLRGSRSAVATYVPPGESWPRRLEVRKNPRDPAKRAVFLVATAGPAPALRAFQEIHAEYPTSSEPHCYRGEVHLYMGEYPEARACFLEALRLYDRTRWAYIGLGATQMLEGDPARALETFRRGIEICGGTGPTLYGYRGEAHRRVGDFERAREDLERAVAQQPSRVGAWVNLAIVVGELGDGAAQREIVGRLAREAPGLLSDAARTLGVSLWEAPVATLAPETTRAVMETILDMLRGNRSSTCVTYFTDAGELRTVAPTFRELPRLDEEDQRFLRLRLFKR